jgi:hypothetical protein
VGVVGPATEDTIVIGNDPPVVRQGGTPRYGARALRYAGAEPCAVETGSLRSLIRHSPSGTRQQILSLPPPLSAERARTALLPALSGCRWVLLGGQTAGDFPVDSIAVLVAAGHHVCLDGQGLSRGSAIGPVRHGPIAAASLVGVTALKLNQAEAEAAGRIDVPELLVTRGRNGALLTWPGGRLDLSGDGSTFADPTGAGDSFSALYCLERTRDRPPPEAAALALEAVQRLYASQ